MIIFELTESSARFITGMIVVFCVLAILGFISQATGIPPLVIIGVMVLLFASLLLILLRSAGGSSTIAPSGSRCNFIRANGSQCLNGRNDFSQYCEHHEAKEAAKTPYAPTTETKIKRSQCGFIREDGTKCKKLKPIEIRRCNYHLKVEEAAK